MKPIDFSFRNDDGKLLLEDLLRGYILRNLKEESLKQIFGPKEDIEWYANNIPYHITQKNIDVLVFHKNFKYTNAPLRYKYSVVELKKDIAKPPDISQLIRYAQWTTGRLANGETEMIQPILIASEFSIDCVKKANETDFNNRGIILSRYKVVSNNKLSFEKLKS